MQELSPSGLLLMRVFFHEIIAAGDDASFMEVCVDVRSPQPDRVSDLRDQGKGGGEGLDALLLQ